MEGALRVSLDQRKSACNEVVELLLDGISVGGGVVKVVVADVAVVERAETLRSDIRADGAACPVGVLSGLALSAGDEVDEQLCVLFIGAALDESNTVGNGGVLLRIDIADVGVVVVEDCGLLDGHAEGVLTGSNELVAVAGAVLKLAVEVGDELLNESPAFIDGGLAEQHGAQLGVSGAGLGGRAVSDLALQVLVAEAFPGGGDFILGEHGLVVDEDHGQRGLAYPVAVGILVCCADELVVCADVRLKVIVVGREGVSTAAPQNVALGIGSLGNEALAQLAGTGGDDFNLDVGILLHELGNACVQRIGIVGRVDNELAGVIFRSFLGVLCGSVFCGGLCFGSLGFLGLGSGLLAASAQREHHAQSQKQCEELLHLVSSCKICTSRDRHIGYGSLGCNRL